MLLANEVKPKAVAVAIVMCLRRAYDGTPPEALEGQIMRALPSYVNDIAIVDWALLQDDVQIFVRAMLFDNTGVYLGWLDFCGYALYESVGVVKVARLGGPGAP